MVTRRCPARVPHLPSSRHTLRSALCDSLTLSSLRTDSLVDSALVDALAERLHADCEFFRRHDEIDGQASNPHGRLVGHEQNDGLLLSLCFEARVEVSAARATMDGGMGRMLQDKVRELVSLGCSPAV